MPGIADGRPEVQIRSWTTTRAVIDDEGRLSERSTVRHEVACVWCVWASFTPDVRDAVRTADEHEMSLGHTHSREEALAAGRARRELWD